MSIVNKKSIIALEKQLAGYQATLDGMDAEKEKLERLIERTKNYLDELKSCDATKRKRGGGRTKKHHVENAS